MTIQYKNCGIVQMPRRLVFVDGKDDGTGGYPAGTLTWNIEHQMCDEEQWFAEDDEQELTKWETFHTWWFSSPQEREAWLDAFKEGVYAIDHNAYWDEV